ncbi:MAG: hypothetical protein IPP27_13775 [Bacteroidetes bacterium]|nr:hypothetical protein [Bacteroidota bacterium]MBK9415464.1 hypothetical protein [Bacteroidota bacterium]MBL0033179.1 hypothetical protein [Bacteroidota bacterium]MBP6427306.1 hypothetical protein [Bacteroidia bacterium]MBP6656524.1 hypothetical protein [Bacteroidia bacterium]
MRSGILFLAALIVIQSGGILLICHIEQAYMKWTMDFNESEIEQIRITKIKFEVHKLDDNEIVIGNQLYDIINKTEVNSILILSVINDKKESNIIRVIKEICSSPFESHKNYTNLLLKLIKLIYSYQSVIVTKVKLSYITNLAYYKGQLYTTSYSNILTPPPQF